MVQDVGRWRGSESGGFGESIALQQQFALVVESVERLRDQQAASGRQIEGLCEALRARAFADELSTGKPEKNHFIIAQGIPIIKRTLRGPA